MVGSSKILTVSYGTFSCTLEGFDDPFSTMRSIAEYFRDLAADDRYFGAEPPTPDAEMLHRIAEREIQRRVEARVDGDDVILRQIDSGLVEDESDLPASQALADMADVAAAAPPADDEPVDENAAAFVEPEEEDIEPAEEADDAPAEAAAREEAPADDSIEEKLNRIRAVVERTRSRDLGAAALGATAEPEDADDEANAAALTPGFAGDVDAALISQVLDQDDADDDTVAFDDMPAEDTDEESLDDLAKLDGAAPEAPESELDEAFETAEADAEETGDDTEDAVARMMAEVTPEDLTAEAEARVQLPSDETEALEVDAPEMVFEAADAEMPEAAQEDEAAFEAEEMVEETAETAQDDMDETLEEDDLWDRDFDAEVAEEPEPFAPDVEDEALEEAPEDLPEPGTVAAARAERPTSKSIHLKTPDEENDRLQTETETAFNEGDGSRRRSAIAHLKAAVAATRADKILSRVVGRDLAGDPEEQKDYREDLSRVVRPSRPLSTPIEAAEPDDSAAMPGDHDEPSDERPSPLMLVSELRVGEEDAGDEHRPRRVSGEVEPGAAASEDDGADFEDFAKRMGATDLTDLMEAAAAYTAYVEGQPHFSRPQIMRRVAKVDPAIEDSREAGLRAFGQLLRQGRIQKLQRGQFTVAEGTRFKPEQRIAGE